MLPGCKLDISSQPILIDPARRRAALSTLFPPPPFDVTALHVGLSVHSYGDDFRFSITLSA